MTSKQSAYEMDRAKWMRDRDRLTAELQLVKDCVDGNNRIEQE